MGYAAEYWRFLRHPSRTASALATDPHCVRKGVYALCVPLVGYTTVYLGLANSGAYPSSFSPWLAIPAEHYYRYNLFLLAPSMLAAWILAAGVVQLLGPVVGARGRFEETLGVLGFAISAGSWTLLPHDLFVATLGALHVIDGRAHEHAMNAPTYARALLWFLMGLYAIAFPVFFTSALRGAHRVTTTAAALLGVVGFVVYQLVFVTFNR